MSSGVVPPEAVAMPALTAEVFRGDLVESEHQVFAVVCDASGAVLHSWGEPGRPVYPRSSLKPLQAFPLVASGAAEALGLTDEEVAIACASHSGEAFHVAAVRSLLAKAGVDEGALRCGAHRPIFQPAADELVRAGAEPTAVHNNCSGKHAGMLALARFLGAGPEGYLKLQHPVQRRILAGLAQLSGVPESGIVAGVDGCSAPTFALPMAGTATAYARLAAAQTGSAAGDAAARRIVGAMMAHPEMIGGTGRFDTRLMQSLPGVLFCKGGAEGFFCAGIPERGVALAMKVADGNPRAVPPAAAFVLERLGVLPDPRPAFLAESAAPPLTNVCGAVIGGIRIREG